MSNIESKLRTVDAAKRELSEAEHEIEKLLREIPVVARAQKTTITTAVEGAFSRLRAAKSNLIELEKLLRADAE